MYKIFVMMGVASILTLLIVYNTAQAFVLGSLVLILIGDHHWSVLNTAVILTGVTFAFLMLALMVFWKHLAPVLTVTLFNAMYHTTRAAVVGIRQGGAES